MNRNVYTQDPKLKVWRKREYSDFSYSDGLATEERMYRDLAEIKNRSVFSEEMTKIQNDWPSLYHFNYARSNLLRPFKGFFKRKRVLELGCGLGALTRFLGECDASEVVAVEGSIHRAKIAALRCEDLPNVKVICETFEHLTGVEGEFDVVTLIGVLEYSFIFNRSKKADEETLKLAYNCLKNSDNSKLILAIENKLGLKYLAGVPEDHIGYSFIGVENAYQSHGVKTFSRKELEEKVLNAGFKSCEQFFAFPDYKLPKTIFFPTSLNCKGLNLSGFLSFSQRAYESPALYNLQSANESLSSAGLIPDLADSLCFVASRGNAPSSDFFEKEDLVKHYSSSSTNDFRFAKETTVKREEGTIWVERTKLVPEKSTPAQRSEPIFQCLEKEKWIDGELVEKEIRKAFLQPFWKLEEIASKILPWKKWLERSSCNGKLPPDFWDAHPGNIIIDSDNHWHYIDREWSGLEPIDFRVVFLRSLCVLLARLGTVSVPFDVSNKKFTTLLHRLYQQLTGELVEYKSLRDLWDEQNYLDLFLNKENLENRITWEKIETWYLVTSLLYPNNWLEHNKLSDEFAQLTDRCRLLSEENKVLKDEAQSTSLKALQYERESQRLLEEIRSLCSSRSWKITRPLRELVNMTRRMKGSFKNR